MDLMDTVFFLALVVFGAYIQTIAGFAMGLVIMGGVTVFDLAPVSFTAAVVSILSLANTSIALRYSHKFVNRRVAGYVCLGLLPALFVGVYLLGILGEASYEWLRRVLGCVIIVAGTLLILKPAPWKNCSGSIAVTCWGVAGGIAGGMFSTGGAPLAFFMYRQPIELNVIRATLISIFVVTTFGRTLVITLTDQLTSEMLVMSGVAMPLVLITTVAARKISPAGADHGIRRMVFVLLILIGISLVAA
jgi:uncharacterized membrane protein YfcA